MPKKKTICQLTAPNFKTLTKAFKDEQVVLVEARRKSDGKIVALLCATNHHEGGDISFVPFAEMVQDNPYEQYDPPNPEGGFHMTTVVYERLDGKVICHVTRDQKKTVCKKNAAILPDLYAGSVPETHCKVCWPRFNG